MSYKKPEQKLVSFSYQTPELEKISKEMKEGWSFISLVRNGSYYVGIMEKNTNFGSVVENLFIPPRKKIKFSL
jgi:hypothetical protein